MSTIARLPRIPQLGALSLALLAGAAFAQDPAIDVVMQAPLQLAQAEFERQIFINEGADPFMFAGGDLAAERVVKGAPYCADAVHETVQWLADGSGGAPNRIVHQQASRMCRDSEGRTRQETERGKRRIVYLRDPVTRENWVLDPERKTARRLGGLHGGAMEGMLNSPAWHEYAEKVKEYARSMAERAKGAAPPPPVPSVPPVPPLPPLPPTPPTAGTAPTPVIITKTEGGPREAQVRIVRMHGDSDAPAGDWPAPPPVQWRAQHGAPRGAGTATPLAAKDIEGLRANGERTAWVIEAGKVGNERPIQIVREVWTAPELMLTLSSRDFDPRSGEVNYRLKNLKRGEPDAALMRVPADFTRPPARPAPPRVSGPTG